MFDLATRAQPDISAAAVAGVPFDWRLTKPLPPRSFPYTDYTTPSAVPTPGTEVLATYALELEDTLSTAVIISLFTDRRAGVDDPLRLHESDRRGWVGDEFMSADFDSRVDAWGSLLWLDYTGKAQADVLEHARFAAREALAWLVRDEIASRVDVAALWVGERQERLAVRPTIYKPGQVLPVYDVLWGTTMIRWAQ